MSMDPDGINRIIKQRISEWSVERDHDRNARLLDAGREQVGLRPRPSVTARHAVVALAGRLSVILHPISRGPWSGGR